MRTISACLVLLLSFCAIVNTQSEAITSLIPCIEQDQKTDNGTTYRVKCGSCKNLTITLTAKGSQSTAELSMNSVCTNCTSGEPANKTCTLKASNANDTSIVAACFDFSTTCSSSTKQAKILSLPVMLALVAMASLVWHHQY